MKVVKFTLNEQYYDDLKTICKNEDITIKKKINFLLSNDRMADNIEDYYPLDFKENPKKITLKINEELYKGIMKNCGKLNIHANKYLPYLIYKYLSTKRNYKFKN